VDEGHGYLRAEKQSKGENLRLKFSDFRALLFWLARKPYKRQKRKLSWRKGPRFLSLKEKAKQARKGLLDNFCYLAKVF
jgi:hypothetical protein